MKKFKNLFLRIFVLVLALFVAIFFPMIKLASGDDLTYIYNTFIGNKSKYNGIIEVWNIDSFESGTASKLSFLENVGKSFQKLNKGTYVIVRNLTKGECQNLLSNGEKPDVISCSYETFDVIKNYLRVFNSFENLGGVYKNYLNAGKNASGDLVGLAWCTGFYALISTKVKLEKANKYAEDVKLNEIAFNSDYEYKIGKKHKKSDSLVYGTGGGIMPKNALLAYNRAGSIQINDTENELIYKSGYAAYSSFLSNNATILLGTQRDICRMVKREANGKVSDVIIQKLMNWTDLVQFAFITNFGDSLRQDYGEKFAKFLTESENQKVIENIGMFPVIGVFETNYKGVMRDIILENFSDLEVKSIF